MYKRIKGTKDYVGFSALKKDYVERIARSVCLNHNMEEIITPIFEDTNLFIRSSGDGSDIVNKEMYSFVDKGKNNITLRPEGTAPVVRSFLENKLYISPGVKKYFYYGPMFRYERPQKGRSRQFHQFGIEYFGEDSYFLDVSCIILVDEIFRKMGINKYYKVLINTIGDFQSRQNYQKVLYNYFNNIKDCLCDDCQKRLINNPLRILDCKIDNNREEFKNAPKIKDFLSSESLEYFENLQKVLDSFDIEYYVDYNLVRGLDYYTDTVFEFIIKGDENEDSLHNITLGGGGKYSNLVSSFDGPNISGIGFAFGIERCLELMDYYNKFDHLISKIDIFLISLDYESKILAMKIGEQLQRDNISFDMDYKNFKLKPQFKLVEKIEPLFIGIIGEDERLNKTISIKHNGIEEKIEINKLSEYIKGVKNVKNA